MRTSPPLAVLRLAVLGTLAVAARGQAPEAFRLVDDFERPDTLYHGDLWETLNPGYWGIDDGALRRRMSNVGDGNPIASFPFHWSNGGKEIPARTGERIPDLPPGMIWRRGWALQGNYTLRARFTVHDVEPAGRGEETGYLGVCFGGATPYESYRFRAAAGDRSWMVVWTRDGVFGLFDHVGNGKPLADDAVRRTPPPSPGETVTIEVTIGGDDPDTASVTGVLIRGEERFEVQRAGVDRAKFTAGLFGLVGYGALDFGCEGIGIGTNAGTNTPDEVAVNALHVCYPLGSTLKKVGDRWTCKFVAIFRSAGERATIRVADTESPVWADVPDAGSAAIVDDAWRRYVAVVDVTLPRSPGDVTLYYTVFKDGVDVTADPRPADPERGYLGSNSYVGRLPQLTPPYRICTLGGHALFGGGTTLPRARTFQENWIHGQPTRGAYQHFEEFDFQVVNWEDDVWYMELLFAPPSTDDAWKIVTLSLANPTTRWQMMRHWNLVNPGDHDYGMDDVKGPEQILVRQRDDLGQDAEYMRRNFSICHLLSEGRTTPIHDENPRDWRRWRMPGGDFAILVLESRLWRTSQDTSLWRERGWDAPGAYDRRNPTRTLLGEEQFGWLQEILHTDTAPWLMVSGVNCMHPVFGGQLVDPVTGLRFAQDDRVAADYAGWCKAGVDRLLELLGSRSGILSVYGDIHLACVVEDRTHRVLESSCGPIGRGGSRRLKEDWAPDMTDYDGRPVRVLALYHGSYQSPDKEKRVGPPHWNFLETVFDPRGPEPLMTLAIRNIVDSPSTPPRGGGMVRRTAGTTGRVPTCGLPDITTLPDADVRFAHLDGRPIVGTRSLDDGTLTVHGLIDVRPGVDVLMTAVAGARTEARIVRTSTPR